MRDTRITTYRWLSVLLLTAALGWSAFAAEAVDAQSRIYPLTVEFAGKPTQFDWLTQIVIRLPDNLANVNALWVSIGYRGAISNKAMIMLK